MYNNDKYFGLRSLDEISILSSLLEHSKIDEEELLVLSKMISILKEDTNLILFMSRYKINDENSKIFESVADHIIQSNFSKQYDLLRLQQRIDVVSSLVCYIQTDFNFNRINAELQEIFVGLNKLIELVTQSHQTLVQTIHKYKDSRKEVIDLIHKAVEEENMVDND